jgi:hypothetical protein
MQTPNRPEFHPIIFPVDPGKPPDKSGEIITGKKPVGEKKGNGEQDYGNRKF